MRLGEMLSNSKLFRANTADIEIIGALLLLLIAFVVFASIYSYVFPLPLAQKEMNIHLAGYVTNQGNVVIEHVGGEVLEDYEVFIDGSFSYKNNRDTLRLGSIIPTNLGILQDETDHVKITVYAVLEDGNKPIVFDGTITGNTHKESTTPPETPPGLPMELSTLQTNSIDEDLICYTHDIDPGFQEGTFIFNWSVFNNPITHLLYSFDTNSTLTINDYSGNQNYGVITEAVWTSQGKIGGAYAFDGINDFVLLPYCFESDTIDTFTVEAWIKTQGNSASLISYDRARYWELGIDQGKIVMSTTSDEITIDTRGTTLINDNIWHYIAASYDADTGITSIYVDGLLDTSASAHDPGSLLGNGDSPVGYIGKGTGSIQETIFSTGFETQEEKNEWSEHNKSEEQQEAWDILTDDTFAGGNWGNYVDGDGSEWWWFGWDCYMYYGDDHGGNNYCVRLRDDNEVSSSFYYDSGIDVHTPEYTSILIDFWVYPDQMDWGDNFYIEYYNGNNWQQIENFVCGSDFWNNQWYNFQVYVNESDYTYPTNMKIRFRCDASSSSDYCYFDDITVSALGGSRIDYDFDLIGTAEMTPYEGSYSIGGTGDLSPDIAKFNRTGIDISGYSDVQLSFWYCYKDTETEDFFGVYYLDNDLWMPLFEENDPQIGSGQAEWTQVETTLPAHINTLILQFQWMTSASNEYVGIDNLEITGMPPGGGENYTGVFDEFSIYNRLLSNEQIYQNYLNTVDGTTDLSVIVAQETLLGDTWKCIVTPNDGIQDYESTESNTVLIVGYLGGG